jgi:hypothetical protein
MRVSAYETNDGRIFKDRSQAKEHQSYLELVELAKTIPAGASSEPVDVLERQRVAWLIEHAATIRKLAKHANDHSQPNGEQLEVDVDG